MMEINISLNKSNFQNLYNKAIPGISLNLHNIRIFLKKMHKSSLSFSMSKEIFIHNPYVVLEI